MYATTRDFVTFSPAQVYLDTRGKSSVSTKDNERERQLYGDVEGPLVFKDSYAERWFLFVDHGQHVQGQVGKAEDAADDRRWVFAGGYRAGLADHPTVVGVGPDQTAICEQGTRLTPEDDRRTLTYARQRPPWRSARTVADEARPTARAVRVSRQGLRRWRMSGQRRA
jgi:hypothetical protein